MPNENPSRLLKFSFSIAKRLPRFAMFDDYKYDIIIKAMQKNLIPKPLDVTKLKEFTGLMSNDWWADEKKYNIIKKAMEKGLIPKLDVAKVEEFTGLVSHDSNKLNIITEAMENDLILELDVEKLKGLTESVSKDDKKSKIIIKAINKSLIPQLDVTNLEKFVTLVRTITNDKNKLQIITTAINKGLIPQLNVEQLKEFVALVKDDFYKYTIIKKAMEKSLIPKLDVEKLEGLTELMSNDFRADNYKYGIITTAINKGLIPEPDVTKLKEFTGLMSNDWSADNYKYYIITTAMQNDPIPQLDVTKLKELTGLMSNDWSADNYKYDIIIKAMEKGLIPQLDVEELKKLTASVRDDKYKCAIFIAGLNKGLQPTNDDLKCFGLSKDNATERFNMIKQVLTNNTPPVIKLNATGLEKLRGLVEDNQHSDITRIAMENGLIPPIDLKTLSHFTQLNDESKFDIIKKAIEKHPTPQLDLEKLKTLTELVRSDEHKCAIFIAALNTGPQPTGVDLGCFGLSKDNATERFNMIKQVLTNNTPPVIKLNATGLVNLLGLVGDGKQQLDIIEIACKKNRNLESKLPYIKTAGVCQKLKNLALTLEETEVTEEKLKNPALTLEGTEVTEEKLKTLALTLKETEATEEIRKYISGGIYSNPGFTDVIHKLGTEGTKYLDDIKTKFPEIDQLTIDFLKNALEICEEFNWGDTKGLTLRKNYATEIKGQHQNIALSSFTATAVSNTCQKTPSGERQ